MEKIHIIIIAVIAVIFMFLLATINSPVMIIAEDTEEYGGVDMAAEFSIKGFSWVYHGSSYNEFSIANFTAIGQTYEFHGNIDGL